MGGKIDVARVAQKPTTTIISSVNSQGEKSLASNLYDKGGFSNTFFTIQKQVNDKKAEQVREATKQRQDAQAAQEVLGQTRAEAVTPPLPVAVYTPPAPAVQSDDYYVNWIINYESGGNPNAVNSIGACGLFQKNPCNVPLGDVAAQMADGLAYINSRYGSPYNAYLHEIQYGWY